MKKLIRSQQTQFPAEYNVVCDSRKKCGLTP